MTVAWPSWIKKAFILVLWSPQLPFLTITMHASDALSLDTAFGDDGKVSIGFTAGDDAGSKLLLTLFAMKHHRGRSAISGAKEMVFADGEILKTDPGDVEKSQ